MKFLIIAIFSLLAFPVLSQHTMSGEITDIETGETLIGATIYFPDLYKGTTSNINGGYKIIDLPTGNFNLEFSFIGYKTKVFHIHLEKDTIINISLVADLKEMKEVIVTGLSKSMELKISPVPAVITTREQLFDRCLDVVDLIERERPTIPKDINRPK